MNHAARSPPGRSESRQGSSEKLDGGTVSNRKREQWKSEHGTAETGRGKYPRHQNDPGEHKTDPQKQQNGPKRTQDRPKRCQGHHKTAPGGAREGPKIEPKPQDEKGPIQDDPRLSWNPPPGARFPKIGTVPGAQQMTPEIGP